MRYAFSDFVLDVDTRQLVRAGRAVPLSPKAFDLLELLLRERPRAVSRTRLRAALWPQTHVGATSLHVLVSQVRTVLEDEAQEPRWIRTVQRFGYAFCGSATGEGETPAAEDAGAACWLSSEEGDFRLREGDNVLGRDAGRRRPGRPAGRLASPRLHPRGGRPGDPHRPRQQERHVRRRRAGHVAPAPPRRRQGSPGPARERRVPAVRSATKRRRRRAEGLRSGPGSYSGSQFTRTRTGSSATTSVFTRKRWPSRVTSKPARRRMGHGSVEQRPCGRRLEVWPVRVDRDGHDRGAGGEQKLLAVAPPPGAPAAPRRDLPFPRAGLASRREVPDVDLVGPRLVGQVGDPPSARSDRAHELEGLSPEKGDRLPLHARRHGQQEEVIPVAGAHRNEVVDDETAVRGPVLRAHAHQIVTRLVLRGEKELVVARAVRRLLVDLPHSPAIREERDPAPVGRPDRVAVVGGDRR